MQAPPPEGAFLYVAFFAQFKESDKTGLMYYNARYYDPRLGRFITADSMVPDPGSTQSFNRYMYVLGNPVRYNDPTGHEDSGILGENQLYMMALDTLGLHATAVMHDYMVTDTGMSPFNPVGMVGGYCLGNAIAGPNQKYPYIYDAVWRK